MAPAPSRFLRDNAFIVAAVALPVLVGAFFVVASAIPRWTVPGPAFDLVMRVPRPYDATPNKVIVEFNVRDGRVEGTARPAPPDQGYSQRWALLYFDHTTMTVREIPFEQPASLAPGEESRTLVVEPLSKMRVSARDNSARWLQAGEQHERQPRDRRRPVWHRPLPAKRGAREPGPNHPDRAPFAV